MRSIFGAKSQKPILERVRPSQSYSVIEDQTTLSRFGRANEHLLPTGTSAIILRSNEDAWRHFEREALYDTRRVTLEHFHLFEWFPLSPGRFHLKKAKEAREEAQHYLVRSGKEAYYEPQGKFLMVHGGIGTVRLRPRRLNGDSYHFMTASSSGVCHEGFPVFVPRELYGPVKDRILQEGAVPITISGEMRYIDSTFPNFFGEDGHPSYVYNRSLLYLHADEIRLLRSPRDGVDTYWVSVVASFADETEGREQATSYMTYATFNPAKEGDLERITDWIENTYVKQRYQGTVVTDFDEVRPRFDGVVFGLTQAMDRTIDPVAAARLLKKLDPYNWRKQISVFYVQELHTDGGDIVGGDKITIGDILNSHTLAVGRGARATEEDAPDS